MSSSVLLQNGVNALRNGDLPQAIQLLRQAVEADPTSADAWTYLGAAYSRSSDIENARIAFGRAIQYNPTSAKARFNMGVLQQMAGDTEAARICYQGALDLDPGYEAARKALSLLPPRVVPMSQLSAPIGQVNIPKVASTPEVAGADADAATKAEAAPAAPAAPRRLSLREIADLSKPQGDLHIMGGQASEADKGTNTA